MISPAMGSGSAVGMNSLQRSGTDVKLDSCWLPPRWKCCYCTVGVSCQAVVAVARRLYSWIGVSLFAFVAAFIAPLHTVRTRPPEVVLARFFQDLCVKCVVSSAGGSHPQVLGGKQGQ